MAPHPLDAAARPLPGGIDRLGLHRPRTAAHRPRPRHAGRHRRGRRPAHRLADQADPLRPSGAGPHRRHRGARQGRRSSRCSARSGCSSGARRASRTSSRSGASSSSALTIVEAFGALVISKDFAFPFFGHARWLGFLRGLLRASPCCSAIIWFAINRLRNAPERKQPRQPLLRIAHRPGVGHPRDDLARRHHAAALPRRAVQHRPLPVGPVEVRRSPPTSSRRCSATARTTRASRRSSCSPRWR